MVEAENAQLRRELASAKLDLEIAKKSGDVFRDGVAVRYAWIEQHRDDYTASRMCRLLEVSRTGYLQWRCRPPSARAQALRDTTTLAFGPRVHIPLAKDVWLRPSLALALPLDDPKSSCKVLQLDIPCAAIESRWPTPRHSKSRHPRR